MLAASYEAKAYGVRTAMNGGQARRLCPCAVVVEPRMSAYSEASKAVFEVFADTTPLVEGLSIDEAFLDVGGLLRLSRSTGRDRRARLRRDVLERVGLAITVGVARTKFLAKVASGVAKPDGLLVVPPDAELEFLHPLPVEPALGCRPGDREQAARSGDRDRRRGRAARRDRARFDARARLGPAPARARAQSRSAAGAGRTAPAIDRHRSARSGARHSRRRSSTRRSSTLVDRVTRRLRAAERECRTVVLRFRFDDFTRATRSHTMPHATAHTATILAIARGLLAEAEPMIERQG